MNFDRAERIATFEKYFEESHNKFYEMGAWSGKSIQLSCFTISYYRTYRRIREGHTIYNKLLRDEVFLKLMHETLESWGMKRRLAKLKEFGEFKKALSKPEIAKILEGIKDETLYVHVASNKEGLSDSVKDKINELFKVLKVMDSSSQLVGNSKTLHHLHPDLFPPMDRQNTVKFFRGNDHGNIPHPEEDFFIKVMEQYCKIYRAAKNIINHLYFHHRRAFDTSIPKVIDNAIWGYMKLRDEERRGRTCNKIYK